MIVPPLEFEVFVLTEDATMSRSERESVYRNEEAIKELLIGTRALVRAALDGPDLLGNGWTLVVSEALQDVYYPTPLLSDLEHLVLLEPTPNQGSVNLPILPSDERVMNPMGDMRVIGTERHAFVILEAEPYCSMPMLKNVVFQKVEMDFADGVPDVPMVLVATLPVYDIKA